MVLWVGCLLASVGWKEAWEVGGGSSWMSKTPRGVRVDFRGQGIS